jgi:Xaa-Pro aminopeptidase
VSAQAHTRIQDIARAVMAALAPAIKPGATEADIAARAQALMAARGVERFWYYGICALVLVGARSIVSVSGRDYAPTDTRVREGDIVTVDLSPCDAQGHWGDYARSFYVQGGAARTEPVPESGFAEGHALELALHDALLRVARPEMTAHDLWAQMDARIRAAGFVNLDFKGNLGHSIERDMNARRYIEPGAEAPLGALGLFTFEPHIRKAGASAPAHGFKREDICAFGPDGRPYRL